MNKSERLKFISEEVNKYGSIRIADTAQKLNVTRETIRHDIAELDKKGVIQSIRGGAVNPYGLENTRFGQRQTLHLAEKQEIAKKALQFIRNNDHIFLDSGTTSWQLAEAIKHSKIERLTVVTNSTFVIEFNSSYWAVLCARVKVLFPELWPYKILKTSMLIPPSLAAVASINFPALPILTWMRLKLPRKCGSIPKLILSWLINLNSKEVRFTKCLI